MTYRVYSSSHTSSTHVKPRVKPRAAEVGDAGLDQAAVGVAGAPANVEMVTKKPESRTRPRTKAAQREATTAALIQAARALFAERGYADVGTEEIVQRGGLTRGALYHNFRGGKEELFRAVLVQISAEVVQRVAEAGCSEGSDQR